MCMHVLTGQQHEESAISKVSSWGVQEKGRAPQVPPADGARSFSVIVGVMLRADGVPLDSDSEGERGICLPVESQQQLTQFQAAGAPDVGSVELLWERGIFTGILGNVGAADLPLPVACPLGLQNASAIDEEETGPPIKKKRTHQPAIFATAVRRKSVDRDFNEELTHLWMRNGSRSLKSPHYCVN